MAVTLDCCPEEALIDQAVSIRVSNLAPLCPVTISVRVEERGKVFGSYAHYTASSTGRVDLTTDVAEPSGMYVGVEPMGLFWSMVAATTGGQHRGRRLCQSVASRPLAFEIRVHEGRCLSLSDVWTEEGGGGGFKLLAKKTLLRSYRGLNVSRVEVESGRLRGTLFVPAGLRHGETRPGVIDMFGSRGGLLEMRAALLASHGFVTMALAYFRYKDLPTKTTFEYEYFEEAARWLQGHPSVAPGGIGMVGVSLGSQIALYMGLNSPLVKAAIGISHLPTFGVGVTFTRAGKCVPCQSLNRVTIVPHGPDMLTFNCSMDLDKFFSVNNRGGTDGDGDASRILFIIGSEDTMVKVSDYTRWVDGLSEAERSRVDVAIYQGAGHLIEPPHAPLCTATYYQTLNKLMYYGGTPKAHAVAQEESWQRIRDFLWSTLGKQCTKSHL